VPQSRSIPPGPYRSRSCSTPVGRCEAQTAQWPGHHTYGRPRCGTPWVLPSCGRASRQHDTKDIVAGRSADPCSRRRPARHRRRRTPRGSRDRSASCPDTPVLFENIRRAPRWAGPTKESEPIDARICMSSRGRKGRFRAGHRSTLRISKLEPPGAVRAASG